MMEISGHIIALPHHITSHWTDIEYHLKPGRALCDVGGKFPWIVSEGEHMRVTRMCPSVSPTSDEREKSYQHHRWGYSVQTHSPDNFINEYFCTNISTRLEWLLGWAQVFIQLAALPALHVKSLALGTLSLLSVTTSTGLLG